MFRKKRHGIRQLAWLTALAIMLVALLGCAAAPEPTQEPTPPEEESEVEEPTPVESVEEPTTTLAAIAMTPTGEGVDVLTATHEPGPPPDTPAIPSTAEPIPTLDTSEIETQLTGTAMAFDTEATAIAGTATAAPTVVHAVAMVTREFVVYDESGAFLGDGEVRLYAPPEIPLDGIAEVRIEILVSGSIPSAELTLNPQPSPTPVLGTPHPTQTPLPGVETQFIRVYEYMGADLRGADINHFNKDAVPPSGLRRMQSEAINWWKWNLSPKGEEAVGVNDLEVIIYLPRMREDGTAFNEETNIIPFQLEVKRGPVKGSQIARDVLTVLEAIAIIGGAIGTFYGGYRFIKARRKQGKGL